MFKSKRTTDQAAIAQQLWDATDLDSRTTIYADVFLRLLLCFRARDDRWAKEHLLNSDSYKVPHGEMMQLFTEFLGVIPTVDMAKTFEELPCDFPFLISRGIDVAFFWSTVTYFTTPVGWLDKEPFLVCSFSECGITLVTCCGELKPGSRIPGKLAQFVSSTSLSKLLRSESGSRLFGTTSYLLEKEVNGRFATILHAVHLPCWMRVVLRM